MVSGLVGWRHVAIPNPIPIPILPFLVPTLIDKASGQLARDNALRWCIATRRASESAAVAVLSRRSILYQ